MIICDFNAEPLFCRTHSRIDGKRHCPDDASNLSNENVMLFLNHCRKHQLSILNTWFDHPTKHRVTWHHPNGSSKLVYDYSLSESWLRQYVTDVRVKNSYFCSDHRLVVTKLNTPANKAARTFIRTPRPIKPDLKAIQNDVTRANILNSIQNHFAQMPCPTSIDDCHDYIIKALTTGREQLPKLPKNQNVIIPWSQDQLLSKLHEARTDLRKKQLTPNVKVELKEIQKKIKTRVRKIQNDELKAKGNTINEARQHRNVAKMWRNAKMHDSSSFKKAAPIQCPGIAEHFKKHFNPDQSALSIPVELEHTPQYIRILQNSSSDMINLPPSCDELYDAIKQLNNGKSTLDIESEIVKLASSLPTTINILHKYYHCIWTTKQIPEQWKLSKTIPIWKNKGSVSDPTKHRGISISSILCKIGMNIILKRTSNFYENQLKRTQFGFRKGTGCNDGIYVVRQLQEIASASQRQLYACFVDLTAAFDHINRKMLFQTIRNRLPANQDTTNIDILQELYKSTKCYIHNSNPVEDSFDTASGVRQGGTEGPPLFNFYFDYTSRVCDDRKSSSGISGLRIPYNIPNEATDRAQRNTAPTSGTCNDDECGYADDLGVFCWTKEELQICMDIISQVFSDFGLEINLDKTETMIFNYNMSSENNYPDSIIKINRENIKNTTAFKYLGTWINHNCLNLGKEELDHRISTAHNAFAQNRKLLTNFNIKLSTRIMFLNALVRSCLTYGCHAWRPTTPEINKIDVTYRFFLRCMIWNGHLRANVPPRQQDTESSEELDSSDEEIDENIDWSFVINNQQLYTITGTESIQQYFSQQQQNWIAHVIRRENNNLCKILTFHSVKRKRLGRKTPTILENAAKKSGLALNEFIKACFGKNNSKVPGAVT